MPRCCDRARDSGPAQCQYPINLRDENYAGVSDGELRSFETASGCDSRNPLQSLQPSLRIDEDEKMTLTAEWIDREREPQCQPNPRFPNGMDVDVSAGAARFLRFHGHHM